RLDADTVLGTPRDGVHTERRDPVRIIFEASPLDVAVLATVPRLRNRPVLELHPARVLDEQRDPALAVLVRGMHPVGRVVEVAQGSHGIVVTKPDLAPEAEDLLVA